MVSVVRADVLAVCIRAHGDERTDRCLELRWFRTLPVPTLVVPALVARLGDHDYSRVQSASAA